MSLSRLPRPLQTARQRFMDAPIPTKLRIALTSVLLIAVIVIVIAAQATVTYSALNGGRLSQTAQLDQEVALLQGAFSAFDTGIATFQRATQPFIATYLDAITKNDTPSLEVSGLVGLNTAFVQQLLKQREIFYEARFLNTEGQQVVRVVRDQNTGVFNVIVTKDLISEASEPYFIQLRLLNPGNAFLTQVTQTGRRVADPTQYDVLLEYAIPFANTSGKTGGYLLLRVVVTPVLQSLIGSAAVKSVYDIALLDESRRFIVANIDNERYLFDNRMSYAPGRPLPDELFGGTPLDFNLSGGAALPGNTEARAFSSRLLEIRTINGIRNWVLVVGQRLSNIYDPLNTIRLAIFVPILLAFAFVILLTTVIGRRLTRPVTEILDAARRIAAGDLDIQLGTEGKDEIGQLSQALNSMARQTTMLIDTLETRVSARTRDLESVSEVSRDLSTIRDVDELLQRTVDALRDRFGFYHVQVFLLDDKGDYALLRSSTGEVGRQLLENKHKLAVGSFSVIGQVTDKGRPFITLDTRNSEVPHRFNPLLPSTRSEMALPLNAAGRLIGALDVQSEKQDAFDDNAVRVFQVLADQLAAAIENSRLLIESKQSAEQVVLLNRQLTRDGWEDYRQTPGVATGFSYDLLNIRPLGTAPLTTGDNMATITVRGETIGRITAANEGGKRLNVEDRQFLNAVAERVALAIENVRLVERTQTALDELQRLYQANRELSAAPDLATVFQIAAEQLAKFEAVQQIGIWRAGPLPVPSPEWMTYIFDWQRDQAPVVLSNKHVALDQFPLLRAMQDPREPLVINNLEDMGEHEITYRSFARTGAQSVIMRPLLTATRWFGMLVITSPMLNTFNPTFVQFTRSISDQLSIAIENRQLFEETQLEARRNRALAEASQISSQIGLDFAEGAQRLLEVGEDAGTYDRWWVGQLDADGHTLRRVSARFPDNLLALMPEVVDRDSNPTAIAEVARTGTPMIVNERSDPSLTGLTPEQVSAYGKHFALPIRAGDGLFGVLMVGRAFSEGDMNDADWQLVGTLVNQLSVSAENRRLFIETQTGRQTLQTVLNSLPAGVVVVDARTRLVTLANREAANFLGLDATGRTPTSTLLPGPANPRANAFAPFQVLDSGSEVTFQDIVIDRGMGDRQNLLVNAVPIYAGDEIVAAVAVFTDTTEIRELEAALQENVLESNQLYMASRAIAGQVDQPSLLAEAFTQIFGLMAADQAFVLFRDEDSEQFSEIYYGDRTTGAFVLSSSTLPFSQSWLDEDQVNTVEATTITAPEPGTRPLRSLVTAPLRARSRLAGWLAIGYYSDFPTADREHHYLSGLADQVAVAAEAARLADQTKRALRETEALFLASRAISNVTELEQIAPVIREQVMRFNPDRIDVFITTDRARIERIKWMVRYEATPPSVRSTVVLDDTYISDIELVSLDPVFVEDIEQASEFERLFVGRVPHTESIRAQMSVPLRSKGIPLGRVIVSFFAPRPFSETDKRFVLTLSEQASTVLDNIVLYRDGQALLDETLTLYSASRAIIEAENDEELAKAISEHVLSTTTTRVIILQLISKNWDELNAYIEVTADHSRLEDSMNLTGIRFTADQFPIWKEISSLDMMYVDNVFDSQRLSDESRTGFSTFEIASFVTAPLVVAGKHIGTLLLGSTEAHEHTDRELQLYTSLANQTAISIENRNLLRQAEERARQLQTSTDVGKAATSTLDLAALMDTTVDLIKESFNYDHVQIFLISEDGKFAELKASTGEPGRQLLAINHKLGVNSASVIGRVTGLGEIYNVLDTADARQTHRPNPFLPNTRSELALPLVAHGKILGALDVQSDQPGTFTPEAELVLTRLADQIAVALDNARLYALSQRRLDESRFLFNVTRNAAAAEIDVALTRVTREVLVQTQSDLTALLLLDQDKRRMQVSYAAREEANYIVPTSLPVEQDLIAQIVRTQLPTFHQDQAGGLLFSVDDVPGIRSMVAIPMLRGNDVIGVLVAQSERPRAYTVETVELLQTLGSTLTAIMTSGRLLADLKEANERLREVDRLKSQFLANMSHELRTPLNSIIGFSRVILKGIDGPLNETQEQDLGTIHESGKHLLNLVNDILDQAKIEAGKMELAAEYFPIDEMIKSVMATSVALVKEKPIRLHQELQANLPHVFGDEFRTRQILLNMLSNAAKFTRQGSITVSAFTVIDGDRPMVQVAVADTGIGISKDNVRRVFAQFEQVDNSTARGAEGTGLGMPIAKSLIEMMGGRIWLESEVGIGSTFNITIPTEPPVPLDNPDDAPAAQPEMVTDSADTGIIAAPIPEALAELVEEVISEAETPGKLLRIVVAIDDQPEMLHMYRRYLSKHGFEVLGTTNPQDAGDLIVNYQPSVILLDVKMPQRNGWDVLSEIKDRDETFRYPVIVCSVEDNKVRAFRLGAADYLVKPFLEEDLLGAIRRVQLEQDLPSVLLVNTNLAALALARVALTSQEDKLRYMEASSSEEAIDLIENHRPTLVVFDTRTPGIDLLAIIGKVRAQPALLKVKILVIPGETLATDDLIRLVDQNVQIESGLSEEMLLAMVQAQLGIE